MNSDIVRAFKALLWALGCTSLLALGPVRSLAQGGDGASEAGYKELIEQALVEFQHKNWPEARVLFTRAHELNPNARTLRGIGVVSFEMRDYPSAVVNLAAALEDKRQPLTDTQRKQCESLLTRARTYVGVYTVKVDPPDAKLTLDGGDPTFDEAGKLLVPFGEHELSGSAPGRATTLVRLTVQGGERGEVTLSLPPEAAPSAVLLAAPDAGTPRALETSPQTAAPPAAPTRSTPKSSAGFRGHGLKYTWVALGASALFGGGAAAFWALGQNKLDHLDAKCADRASSADACTPQNTNTDKVKLYENLTNASIGVSAAALLTAGILMGLEWPRERRLSFGVGPRSVTVRGAF